MINPPSLHLFKKDLSGIATPERFTFPFCYTPHPLSIIASEELQHYINHQQDWSHNFGLGDNIGQQVIGKMFGVLVVRDENDMLGYLCAFSGKLAGKNDHPHFVPPVFDMLTKDSFFLQEETVINELNSRINDLEQNTIGSHLRDSLQQLNTQAVQEVTALKNKLKNQKVDRKQQRDKAANILTPAEYHHFEADLIKQSLRDKHLLSVLQTKWAIRISEAQHQVDQYVSKLNDLKNERKARSAALQNRLFEQYVFLNGTGETKNIRNIFWEFNQSVPPAGAGECAAPKLLHYAFSHGLTPIAMAEFWWGDSPTSEIRQHQNYYPACKGKCEPILTHMLKGMMIEDNPLLALPVQQSELRVVYEDDDMAVIDKPAELLSVPGITIEDSVYSRIKILFPHAEGPLIVHRLDMSTSGLLLIAKTKQAHKALQQQFIDHTIEKRYIAVLDGQIESNEGIIDLPLRVDLDDRPRQVVCYQYGKRALTKFKILERTKGKTRILFYPITGRTHQLRVHAAHRLGLNTPIVGDDLYGKKAHRLHLHAAYISFLHPTNKSQMSFDLPAPF